MIEQIRVGKNIKAARTKCNLSQNELAMKTEISTTQISDYENDKGLPSLQTAAVMARALEISINELYYGKDNIPFMSSAPDENRIAVNCIYINFGKWASLMNILPQIKLIGR